jgi:hypothetical protein
MNEFLTPRTLTERWGFFIFPSERRLKGPTVDFVWKKVYDNPDKMMSLAVAAQSGTLNAIIRRVLHQHVPARILSGKMYDNPDKIRSRSSVPRSKKN